MGIKIPRSGTLTGAYTPEVDTHALGGSGGVDSHSQAKQNIGTNGTEFLGSASTVPDTIATTDRGTAEEIWSETTVTPDNATNLGRLSACGVVLKLTNVGTWTIRLKEGAGVLASTTSVAIGVNISDRRAVFADLTNITAVLHTYNTSVQFNTTGGRVIFTDLSGCVVSLSGAAPVDTHALSGALTPSIDTHAVSAGGIIELGS